MINWNNIFFERRLIGIIDTQILIIEILDSSHILLREFYSCCETF